MKVMNIDDANFMRMMLKKHLEDMGHEVIAEGWDGPSAITNLKKIVKNGLYPDVITLDITMPKISGIDILPDLRQISPGSRIIMVSAMGQQGMVIEAISKGATDFIVKPFKPDQLDQAIRGTRRHHEPADDLPFPEEKVIL